MGLGSRDLIPTIHTVSSSNNRPRRRNVRRARSVRRADRLRVGALTRPPCEPADSWLSHFCSRPLKCQSAQVLDLDWSNPLAGVLNRS